MLYFSHAFVDQKQLGPPAEKLPGKLRRLGIPSYIAANFSPPSADASQVLLSNFNSTETESKILSSLPELSTGIYGAGAAMCMLTYRTRLSNSIKLKKKGGR